MGEARTGPGVSLRCSRSSGDWSGKCWSRRSRDPPAEGTSFLRRACRSNVAARQEVESLLAADQAVQGFLDPAAAPHRLAPDLVDRLGRALADRYRLVAELGGGGMSCVFMAQEVALGMRVVIKVHRSDASLGARGARLRAGSHVRWAAGSGSKDLVLRP
jgi:hypothetical protein